MGTITEQCAAALSRSGLSVAELARRLERVGVKLDRSSLTRKLRGQQGLDVKEAEAIASVLAVTLVWMPAAAESPKDAA